MSKGKFYAGDFHLGYCAFCKHWYDPTNSAIKPLPGNWWEFDREKEGVYTITAEAYGIGIDMWLGSQGNKVKVIQ